MEEKHYSLETSDSTYVSTENMAPWCGSTHRLQRPKDPDSSPSSTTEKLTDLGQGGLLPKTQLPALQDGDNNAFLPGL